MTEDAVPTSTNEEKRETAGKTTTDEIVEKTENLTVSENGKQEGSEKVKEDEEELIPAKRRTANKEKQEDESQNCEDRLEENEAELDDDQKVENPAYIPKVGKFYMHDDNRLGDAEGDNAEEEEAKKKSRADCEWKHDRFDPKFQAPKTKRQIVTKYGFDIRSDQKDVDVPAGREGAPESTEDDSEIQNLGKKQRVGNRQIRPKTGPSNRRRPMRQREREDTVEESEGKTADEEPRPAQRRMTKKEGSKPPARAHQQNQKGVSRSSEEDDEEEEEVGLRRGQRRNAPMSRGTGSRLRGRLNTFPARKSQSRPEELGSSRFPPGRRVRGGFGRGVSSVRGSFRGEHRAPPSSARREYNGDDDRFENHRRGVMRGGGSRGVSRGFSRPPRGADNSARSYTSRGRRDENSEYTEREYQGSGTDYTSSSPRQQHQTRGVMRGSGGYARGGRNAGIGPATTGYNNSGRRGYNDYGRGSYNHQQKQFPVPQIMPPVVPVGPASVIPPQMTSGTTHGPPPPQIQHGIRPSPDMVFFDPQQQQVNRQPPPSRAKKVIPIVDPNTAKNI